MGRGVVLVAGLLLACARLPAPAVQDLRGGEDLSRFRLGSLRGNRDGDKLQASAMFSDSSSILTLDLRFRIGSPTTLESGRWQWARDNRLAVGTVVARSVTFLGGQSGPPSVGGTFDLVGQGGTAQYRATIPIMELKPRSKLER